MAKSIPILNPAPDWKSDRSDFVILWHGCTAFDKNGIEGSRINLTYCAVDTDFGRGFYTTTVERQARQWAWDRFYDWQAKHPGVSGNQPVVLRFRVPRYNLASHKVTGGLDELLALQFVGADYHDEDYWSLVQHCRNSTLAAANDHRRAGRGWYDLVVGPVAAFWRQRVAMNDADQFSFHTGRGIDLLNRLIDEGKGKGVLRTGDPDFYQWQAVP